MPEPSVVVISPTIRTNALGRAICIAELASEAFTNVHLYGPRDGDIWRGAQRSPLRINRFTSSKSIVSKVRSIEAPLVVWVVKPLSTSWHPASKIASALPETKLVLDVDDADEALSRQFMSVSVANRLRIHPWNPLNPRRIKETLQNAATQIQGLTYASDAVRDLLKINFNGPTLRVPHPRHRTTESFPSHPSDDHINLGFLGTLREHKGLRAMEQLMAERPQYRLHVFRGAIPGKSGLAMTPQVIEHDADAPMDHVYSQIDVVILPQDDSVGARVQLPAKLLDAMRFGKPIVASWSPAIFEAAGDTITYVTDWELGAEIHPKIAAAASHEPEQATKARSRFADELSLEAQIQPLRDFMEATVAWSRE
jgi:hypothetical protein